MTCPVKVGTCHRETEKMCPTRLASGEPACTLGKPHLVFEVALKDDKTIVGGLSSSQSAILVGMAQKFAGEVLVSLSNLDERARDRLAKLVDMGLLSKSEIVGTNSTLFRLTDVGRNITTQIIASEP